MTDEAPFRPQARRPRDPGLQPERTALAWNRTGLSLVVNALLVLRAGWTSSSTPLVVVAFALLIAAGSTVFYGAWRRRHLGTGLGMTAAPALAILAAASITLVACVAGAVSMFVR